MSLFEAKRKKMKDLISTLNNENLTMLSKLYGCKSLDEKEIIEAIPDDHLDMMLEAFSK